MCKKIWAIAKINLKNLKGPYLATGITAGALFLNTIVFVILSGFGLDQSQNGMLSPGSALYLLPVTAAIAIPAKNFRRIMNLGGKRDNFFWGSLECYAILAGAVSLANILIYYTFDRFVKAGGYFDVNFFGGIVNLVEVFGWIRYGGVAAFFQQFAFLFLFAVFVHTLTATQDKWYGWASDVAIVAIICVFTPIAPLRSSLIWFFRAIIFHQSVLFQIGFSLVLAMALYLLNKLIFARKAI